MKFKILPLILSTSIFFQCSIVAANDDFNPEDYFKNYVSYDDSQVSFSYKHFYVVSNSNEDNCKALFSENIRLTDFMYHSIKVEDVGIIVSRIENDTEFFGLINYDGSVLLPTEYKKIENYEVRGYIAERESGEKEFYVIKSPISDPQEKTSSYMETETMYCYETIEDLYNVLPSSSNVIDLIPIEGLSGVYISDTGNGFTVNIVDQDRNKLIDIDFRCVENSLGKENTLKVSYPVGMNDSSYGFLDNLLTPITPHSGEIFGSGEIVTENGTTYAKMLNSMTGEYEYYDMQGNKTAFGVTDTDDNKATENSSISNSEDINTDTASDWAKNTIVEAIQKELVPQELQSAYTEKITRKEFCQLAVQTYIAKTGYEMEQNPVTPFTDVNDRYITTAYNLKIVAGVGNDKFAPDNNITRQEAAVMLNNLASVLGVDNTKQQTERFIDEEYFAEWAKDAIYTVSAIKSEDTFVMVGTGSGKFSPWMNYTREQAIATMLRLYNIS